MLVRLFFQRTHPTCHRLTGRYLHPLHFSAKRNRKRKRSDFRRNQLLSRFSKRQNFRWLRRQTFCRSPLRSKHPRHQRKRVWLYPARSASVCPTIFHRWQLGGFIRWQYVAVKTQVFLRIRTRSHAQNGRAPSCASVQEHGSVQRNCQGSQLPSTRCFGWLGAKLSPRWAHSDVFADQYFGRPSAQFSTQFIGQRTLRLRILHRSQLPHFFRHRLLANLFWFGVKKHQQNTYDHRQRTRKITRQKAVRESAHAGQKAIQRSLGAGYGCQFRSDAGPWKEHAGFWSDRHHCRDAPSHRQSYSRRNTSIGTTVPEKRANVFAYFWCWKRLMNACCWARFYRPPKILLPTRTIVLPFWMARG